MVRQQVENLRIKMKENFMDAYIIMTDDFHASEYVGDYFKCREYVSGFDGSAGTLIVTQEKAALWTDGRYFLQAEEQLSNSGIDLMRMGEPGVPSIDLYLYEELKNEQCVGYDGRTVTASYSEYLKKRLANRKLNWKEDIDLVDEIWNHRPPMSAEPVWILEKQYAGKSRLDKIKDVRQVMIEKKADYLLISALDEICWLYNIRGNDVDYNPVVLSYTLISAQGAILYVNPKCISDEVKSILEQDGVTIKEYLQIYEDLNHLKNLYEEMQNHAGQDNGEQSHKEQDCEEQNCEEHNHNRRLRICCDKTAVNTSLISAIPENIQVVHMVSPVKLAKAVKNPVEMENEIQAHVQDGIAVTKLIYWLKTTFAKEKEGGKITELDVCNQLEMYRKEASDYLGQSFAPIAGSGTHGAIIHYEPTKESNIELVNNSFCLLDTGGHYLSGTTDVTRTISCGTLSVEQKRNYTAVLCGNLNIGSVYFKYGCTGANFDYLARTELWKLGLDYKHGTGHGVGYILNVHEGPNAIRLKNSDNSVGTVFEEGMITSNEPGVYLENQYGIRIENLIMCVKDQATEYGQFMKMRTLTLVPFDRDAIDIDMLDSRQRKLLNDYHKEVYEKIGPHLNAEEREWLKRETETL